MIHQSEFKVSYKDESRIVCTYMPGSDDFFVKAGNNYKIEIEYMLKNDGFYQRVSREKTGFDYIKPDKVKTYYSKISICEGDMRS